MVPFTTNAVLSAVIAPAAPPPPVSKPANVMDTMTMQSKTGQSTNRATTARLEVEHKHTCSIADFQVPFLSQLVKTTKLADEFALKLTQFNI